MEKNTVKLKLSTYDHLRDFKNEIEAGNTYMVATGSRFHVPERKFIGTDEALGIMAAKLKILEEENENLRKKTGIELTLSEVKKMNWWQFRKWRMNQHASFGLGDDE